MAQYGKPEYWEDRYQNDSEPFEWYQHYSALKGIISENIPKKAVILHAGCGSSRLPEEMYDDGYKNITNIDISKTVIELMAKRNAERTGLAWKVENVLSLSYPDQTFDAILDKGTLDSLFCSDGSTAMITIYLTGLSRVLKSDGVCIIVSYGPPDRRLPFLEGSEYHWNVSTLTLPKINIDSYGNAEATDPSEVDYIYILRKK